MKNYRQIDTTADPSPYSQIQGLRRVTRGNESFKMAMTVDVAFQTAVAGSRFRANFYDLSLKIIGNKNSDRQQVLVAAVSSFALSLAEIRTARGFANHDDVASKLLPPINSSLTYRVRVVNIGCFRLFDGFHHFDTFAFTTTSARDSELISREEATALIADADTLFGELKRALLSSKD